MEILVLQMPTLLELSLFGFETLWEFDVSSCPQLHTLHLSFCRMWSSAGYESLFGEHGLARKLPSLVIMNLPADKPGSMVGSQFCKQISVCCLEVPDIVNS